MNILSGPVSVHYREVSLYSNPASLDCKSGILPLSYRAPHKGGGNEEYTVDYLNKAVRQ